MPARKTKTVETPTPIVTPVVPVEKTNYLQTTAFAMLLGSLIIAFSILHAAGSIKIPFIKSPMTYSLAGTAALPTVDTGTLPTEPDDGGIATISIDDDPIQGDPNAPITLIEFSDYECPFCKAYFDDTYALLKKDYIDTGKVKLVFRDLPLSFHDPLATIEANAASCVREQLGDKAYFQMHDLIFTNTTSNGNGLTREKIDSFAGQLGVNVANYKSCVDSGKYDEEISNDIADAAAGNATGTPTFFIGKSTDDGVIQGTRLVGAQPYSAFKTIIDQHLAQ